MSKRHTGKAGEDFFAYFYQICCNPILADWSQYTTENIRF